MLVRVGLRIPRAQDSRVAMSQPKQPRFFSWSGPVGKMRKEPGNLLSGGKQQQNLENQRKSKIMSYQSVNPYNGKVLRTFEELSNNQLETSIETAANCFESWRRTTFAERALVAGKAASIMRARIGQFASLVTLEMGKLIEQSR